MSDRVARAVLMLALRLSPGCGSHHEPDGGVTREDGGVATRDGDTADAGTVCALDGPVETSTRRLSQSQIRNTLRTHFGQTIAESFAPSYEPVGQVRPESSLPLVSELMRIGERVGANHTCAGEASACVTDFIDLHLASLWRRALEAEERAELRQLGLDVLADGGDGPEAVAAVAIAALTSASFLFVVEDADPTTDERIRVTGSELATRLSLFLWDEAPDETLRTDPRLDDDSRLEEVVEDLLSDPRAARGVGVWTQRWADLNDDDLDATAAEAAALVQEVVLHGDGRWSTLVQTDLVYVTPESAPIYGVPATESGLHRSRAPAGERFGILTTRATLAVPSSQTAPEPSPVLRGNALRARLLCAPIVAHPDHLIVELDASLSLEERLDASYEVDAACQTCHRAIDGLGWGLSAYDAEGRRTEPGRFPLEIAGAGDLDGTYPNLPALATAISESAAVRTCIAAQWVGHAYALTPDLTTTCETSPQQQFLIDGDIRALMRAIATSEAFRSRQ